jgi:hypothetical protein
MEARSPHAAECRDIAEALKAELTLVYVVTKPVPLGPEITRTRPRVGGRRREHGRASPRDGRALRRRT